MHGQVDLTFKNETMKTKFIISISLIFLLFNSCKKIREKVFSTRMEGKVIDMQTGKGIPNAKLVVYRSQAYPGGGGLIRYFALKTFYADKDGNFKDKLKIKTTEEDETYANFKLKAEPDGYEKTEGNDYPISGTGIMPFVNLNLTKPNKDLELKCNPEFNLDLTLIDEEPLYVGTNKFFYIEFKNGLGGYPQPNGGYAGEYFNENQLSTSLILPSADLFIVLRGYNNSVIPTITDTLLKYPLSLKENQQIILKY
jgi:hypothetical protein